MVEYRSNLAALNFYPKYFLESLFKVNLIIK